MKISVIIPTCNRKESLREVLEAYSRQTFKDFEIIIVDDGSADGTGKLVEALRLPYQIKYIWQENSGPAVARNRGLKEARSEIVFFTGDDIFPEEDLLEQHMQRHQRNGLPAAGENFAVLGYTKFAPRIRFTPFRRYLSGYHFAFHKIKDKDKDNVDWGFFYTSNVSLKRSFIEKVGGFDEEFRFAAYEDTELAWRLHQQGIKMIFNKQALAHHNHSMDFCSYCQAMERKGQAAVILAKKVPSLSRKASYGQSRNIFRRLLKKLIFNNFIIKLLSFLICFLDKISVPLPQFVYVRVLDYYRIKGIKKARKLV